MNNVEAKFILQAYRADGSDATDATFAPALAQLGRDPGLREWFAREQAFDRAISAKLAEVPVPAGLREAILAGGRVTESAGAKPRVWQRPAWWAMAASVSVLLAAGIALWPVRAGAEPALAKFALADAQHPETHGGHGQLTGALQASLARPTARLGDPIPVDFAALRTGGCRSLTFHGHEVLEVCFQRNGVWFHCYIAQRVDFPALVASVKPAVANLDGTAVAMWSDASLLYVVVSEAGRSALERLL